MALVVRYEDLGKNDVEAYFTRYPRPTVVIDKDLPLVAKEARRLEALGYTSGRWPEEDEKFCRAVCCDERLDKESVFALHAVLEKEKPEWVERVLKAAKEEDAKGNSCPHVVAAMTGLPFQVMVACCCVLNTRGDLPPNFAAGCPRP